MKPKRHAASSAATAPARPAAPPAPHVEVPDQADDYRSRWNGARIKTIGTPHAGMKTKQTHRLYLPELCPASHNPLPGSTMLIFYKTRSRFLEVFSLSAYIQAAIGHPLVRDVEALTQAVALDCAAALGQKVHVEGRFQLRGLDQEVICITRACPPKSKSKGKGKKGSKALPHGQATRAPRPAAIAAVMPSSADTTSAGRYRAPAGDESASPGQGAAARRPRKPTRPSSAGQATPTASTTASGGAAKPAPRARATKATAAQPRTTGRRHAGATRSGTGTGTADDD